MRNGALITLSTRENRTMTKFSFITTAAATLAATGVGLAGHAAAAPTGGANAADTVTTLRSDLYSMNSRFDPMIRGFECAGWISVIGWGCFVIVLAARWSRVGHAERVAAIGFAGGTFAGLLVLIDYHVLTSTLNY